ncbi:hypothetical protein PsYK624_157630 [Phanerochaete sordida]|uniref:Uncharacterized protein n=1 Tax=Phanerochaete sordida TaxID=48140 RepID=A0A9P3GTN2_9APHY|nr:hypothetical protein PsYK624_157630 [Phanerochaete sordida]
MAVPYCARGLGVVLSCERAGESTQGRRRPSLSMRPYKLGMLRGIVKNQQEAANYYVRLCRGRRCSGYRCCIFKILALRGGLLAYNLSMFGLPHRLASDPGSDLVLMRP